MMKHGVIVLALTCWMTAAVFAAEAGIPASDGMPGLSALTGDELAAIEGGDLLLSVNRDQQMMVVTRINPGSYDNIQCYAVKVTTSVVPDSQVKNGVEKGSMVNTNRFVASANPGPNGDGIQNTAQFPTGTANLSPRPQDIRDSKGNSYGLGIMTNATQVVPGLDAQKKATQVVDSGYAIHYVSPAQASNTLGCIGVQSMAGMNKVLDSQKLDNTTYKSPAAVKQTVTVTSYTKAPPPAQTFKATETVKPSPKPSWRFW